MKTPNFFTLHMLINYAVDNQVKACINGKWVLARPIGFHSFLRRLELTWLVFTGKCDVLEWPEGQ